MVSARSYPWAILTKREERVVEVTQEDDDDEIDELAGNEGEPWHSSTSPGTHARRTPSLPHHLRTLDRMVMALRQRYYSVSS